MKAHIGVDRDSGLVHTVVSTAAHVSDISQTPELLHGQETELWADAGYVGVDKREDMQTALANNEQTHIKTARSQASQHDRQDGRRLAEDDGTGLREIEGASTRKG